MSYEKAREACEYLSNLSKLEPKIGLILGSGLGSVANEMTDATKVAFDSIPYFAKSTVKGHAGEVIIGKLKGIEVLLVAGRYHYYEGHSLEVVTFPIRVMHLLGIKTLIVTNSCGAINEGFNPGDLMIISDHLNLVANNPLIGKNIDEFGPRFPDASNIYTKSLRKTAHDVACIGHNGNVGKWRLKM